MPLARLTSPLLARIKDMVRPNAIFYPSLYIWYLIDGCSFLSVGLQKEQIM